MSFENHKTTLVDFSLPSIDSLGTITCDEKKDLEQKCLKDDKIIIQKKILFWNVILFFEKLIQKHPKEFFNLYIFFIVL